MDKKSKIFFFVFFCLAFAMSVVSFYKYYIKKDFYIKAETECDPIKEKCFVYACDPSSDENCPENESERTSYYKYVEKKAFAIQSEEGSELDAEEGSALTCKPNEDCKEILCDETTLEEGIECNNPLEYKPADEEPSDKETNTDESTGNNLETETGSEAENSGNDPAAS